MGDRYQRIGKVLVLIGLLVLLVLSSVACTRDSATITSVDVKPLVAATFGAKVGPTLSEGVVVVVQSNPLEKDELYQMAVTSPKQAYRWERSVQPFTVGDLLYLGMNDLLLPADLKLEQGIWSVEIFTPEGERISETFDFNRPFSALTKGHMAVSIAADMAWESHDGKSLFRGIGTDDSPIWHYRFYDVDENILAVLDSTDSLIQSPLFDDHTLQERTHMVVAMRFDDESGIYLMVRKLFI